MNFSSLIAFLIFPSSLSFHFEMCHRSDLLCSISEGEREREGFLRNKMTTGSRHSTYLIEQRYRYALLRPVLTCEWRSPRQRSSLSSNKAIAEFLNWELKQFKPSFTTKKSSRAFPHSVSVLIIVILLDAFVLKCSERSLFSTWRVHFAHVRNVDFPRRTSTRLGAAMKTFSSVANRSKSTEWLVRNENG